MRQYVLIYSKGCAIKCPPLAIWEHQCRWLHDALVGPGRSSSPPQGSDTSPMVGGNRLGARQHMQPLLRPLHPHEPQPQLVGARMAVSKASQCGNLPGHLFEVRRRGRRGRVETGPGVVDGRSP